MPKHHLLTLTAVALFVALPARAASQLVYEIHNSRTKKTSSRRVLLQAPFVRDELWVSKKLNHVVIRKLGEMPALELDFKTKTYLERLPVEREKPAELPRIEPMPAGKRKVGKWTCEATEIKVDGKKAREACVLPPEALGLPAIAKDYLRLSNLAEPTDGETLRILVESRILEDGAPVLTTELIEVKKLPDLPESHFHAPKDFKKKESKAARPAAK